VVVVAFPPKNFSGFSFVNMDTAAEKEKETSRRERMKQAMKDSSEWNGLLHYHRKLRGFWNDPNTGLTFPPKSFE
jgi:hypothetical protein